MFQDLITSNRLALDDAIAVLGLVDDEEYVCIPSAAHGSSIGEHVRHVVDHYLAVLEPQDGIVDYTRRRRGSAMENDRSAAREVIQSIDTALAGVEDREIEVLLEVTVDGDRPQRAGSTLARELAFVSSHATHHFALVALLLTALGKGAPKDFGVAPTTLKWRQQLSIPSPSPAHHPPPPMTGTA